MKAIVSVNSLSRWEPLTVPLAQVLPQVLPQVGKTERKTFPHSEAMAFESELQKPNFELTLVVEETPAQPRLVAYAGITRTKGTALLHKLCVVEEMRNQGIATTLLRLQVNKLEFQGCGSVQLWVDESRESAKHLYDKFGFNVVRKVEDYYGPGRSGLRMILRLNDLGSPATK